MQLPRTVNEEVGFLLRIMDELGDILRVRLKKRKLLKLKVGKSIGKALTEEEKVRMLEVAKSARSPHIYPAIMLRSKRRHTGCRTQTAHLGPDKPKAKLPDCRREQDGGR